MSLRWCQKLATLENRFQRATAHSLAPWAVGCSLKHPMESQPHRNQKERWASSLALNGHQTTKTLRQNCNKRNKYVIPPHLYFRFSAPCSYLDVWGCEQGRRFMSATPKQTTAFRNGSCSGAMMGYKQTFLNQSHKGLLNVALFSTRSTSNDKDSTATGGQEPMEEKNPSLSTISSGEDKNGKESVEAAVKESVESTEAHDVPAPKDYGFYGNDPRFIGEKPTLEYARSMPLSFSAMRHEQILQLSAEGSLEARKEALIRNIMAVDLVEYDEAEVKFQEIAKSNRQNMFLHHVPHRVGLFLALGGGFLSIPLIFYFPVVNEFNRHFVTADLPPDADLETWLEVGAWSWSWMEPVIGQISFLLLCLQFARSQLQNMGLMPYTNLMRAHRAKKLIELYPRYDAKRLEEYSMSDSYYYRKPTQAQRNVTRN